jgi:ABC-type glycerol-3-phosphate transport system substrate-binding protein
MTRQEQSPTEHSDSSVEDDPSRRDVLKSTGAAASAGAMGSLAGFLGDDLDQTGRGDTAAKQPVTVSYWSAHAAENTRVRNYFQESMKNFQDQEGDVQVDLQPVSYGDMKQRIVSAVEGGNPPDAAESGTAGLPFFFNDVVPDHGQFLEETEGLPGNWTQAAKDAANFRGTWWSAGPNHHTGTMLGVRPKFFKEVGVNDPEQLNDWTGFRQALEQIKEQFPNTWAYEETGVYNDLESYWGQARTAYTGGSDPWFGGENPWQDAQQNLRIGSDPRTDGMIINTVDLANAYSSSQAASRGDEEIPSLMLTDRVASYTYGVGNAPRYQAVKDDVTFGWDGDIYQRPIPKLDPNYGNEFGISQLADEEGEHGGHLWGLEYSRQVFNQSQNPDKAWSLLAYTLTDPFHNVQMFGELYPALASFQPLNQQIQDEYGDQLPQIQQAMYDAIVEYGSQYNTTGAVWDLRGTDQIRWTDVNQTISQSIAGDRSAQDTPGTVRDRVTQTLEGEGTPTTTPAS